MRVLTLFLMMLTLGSYAQKQGQDRLDSLELLLAGDIADSIKLNVLSSLSFEYHNINPGKGIKYGEELFALAGKLEKKKYIGYAFIDLGINYVYKPDYPKALEYELKAVEIFEELRDSVSIAKVYNNLGLVYFNLSDNPKALEYYYKALVIYERYNIKGATTLGNIGLIYQVQGDIDKALYMSKKALKDFTAMKDKTGIARMNLNIGDLLDVKQDFVKSLNYKYNALRAYLELGEVSGIAKTYEDLGYTYLHIATDSIRGVLPDSLHNRAALLDKAEYYVRKAIGLHLQNGFVERLGWSYDGLSKILMAKKDYKKAIEYYTMAVNIRDSIYSNDHKNRIHEIESQKENELKARELKIKNLQIRSDKLLKTFMIAGLCCLLLFSFYVYRNFIAQKHTNKLLGREKKKSDDLLLNILPEEVAEELKTKGNSEAKLYNNVTVLFTDFVNFTGLSEQLSPTELVTEIHRNFTAFDAIIEKNGLEKIKTIGDAYMAVCGLPNETADHAQRVIRAALDIQKHTLESGGKFQIRIGVNSGPVVAGIVGVKKYAYDIWGDTVNMAARMEQNSEAGKINISGATYELIKNEFVCEHRGKIKAKNKGEVDMYFVHKLMT